MGLERLEAADREALDADLPRAVGEGPEGDDFPRLVDRVTMDTADHAGMHIAEAIGRAWMMGARVAINTAMGRDPCRICGCWERKACDQGCGWAEPGLCTACAEGS